ncbi:hypothetical protein [Pseudonocardia dioxanivorans]|uniref:hypothetical protein n=1 Tax=Pseudonocardia dioxanivorans TaxID=240495 RepID=UPI000CD1146A|nr:hypothetical protein [Pseudonocardia dioxanivorans]
MSAGVHLVGSVPLESTEAVFRAATTALGDLIGRLPDGETGDRTGWVGFQLPLLQNHPDFVMAPRPGAESADDVEKAIRAESEDYEVPVFRLRDGADPARLTFGDLGYARAALDSWKVFSAMQDAGEIGAGVRFQVSLPTPLAPLLLFVDERDHLRAEPAYRAAMLRELDAICAAVPHERLAVQWDVAPELALIERAWPSVFGEDVEREVVDRVAAVGAAVPDDVQLGFHFCYGDLGHQHFVEPADMRILVDLCTAVRRGVPRRIDWVHMPVPRSRDDDAYFAPLRDLELDGATELFLGLVHATDGLDGAARRIAAARRATTTEFGVGTECGLGRRAPESVPALLDLHRAAAGLAAEARAGRR